MTATCHEWTGREDVLVIPARLTRDKNPKSPPLTMLYNNICDQITQSYCVKYSAYFGTHVPIQPSRHIAIRRVWAVQESLPTYTFLIHVTKKTGVLAVQWYHGIHQQWFIGFQGYSLQKQNRIYRNAYSWGTHSPKICSLLQDFACSAHLLSMSIHCCKTDIITHAVRYLFASLC